MALIQQMASVNPDILTVGVYHFLIHLSLQELWLIHGVE